MEVSGIGPLTSYSPTKLIPNRRQNLKSIYKTM
jgi:hypothetical protein